MQTSPLEVWLILHQVPQLSAHHIHQLLEYWHTPQAIIAASETDLQAHRLTSEQITYIKRPDQQKIKNWKAWGEKKTNRAVLTWDNPHYPALLKQIPAPPILLFCEGDVKLLSEPQLAIVGSRRPSPNGIELTHYFAKELVNAGLTITSGLALGIDAASHQAALAAEGKTIAVLGSGLNHIYPQQHDPLAKAIIENHGLLLSEFSPETPPKRYHFPQRNRIISGLSLGVLVVEAALRSGSLITARLAVDYGREVFALPGSLFHKLSHGCLYLIQQGAKLVTHLDDILIELTSLTSYCYQSKPDSSMYHANFLNSNVSISQKKQIVHQDHDLSTEIILDQQQQKLLQCVDYSATHIDLLIARSGMMIPQIMALIPILELAGYIALVPGGYLRLHKR